MGISYEHLSVFGRLRKISRLGPVSMFFAVWRLWGDQYSVAEVAAKVKFFFRCGRDSCFFRHAAVVMTADKHKGAMFRVCMGGEGWRCMGRPLGR